MKLQAVRGEDGALGGVDDGADGCVREGGVVLEHGRGVLDAEEVETEVERGGRVRKVLVGRRGRAHRVGGGEEEDRRPRRAVEDVGDACAVRADDERSARPRARRALDLSGVKK